MAIRGIAPYRAVLTHGFVLDGQGRAMSKSVGNVVAPEEIIKKYGADVLRLWVAASDYRDDVRVSGQILDGLAEGYRKIRNTVRWALGNLAGFDPESDAVPVAEMEPFDRWAYARLVEWQDTVSRAYAGYEFHVAYHATMEFVSVTLSSVYFDVVKDRLYTARTDGQPRRSAQTLLHMVAQDLLRMLAPVLSFTAHEAWKYLPGRPSGSVFEAGLPARPPPADGAALSDRYAKLLAVRAEAMKALELARRDKLIGSGLEAQVTITAEGDTLELLRDAAAELPTLLIVSQVLLAPGSFTVKVERAPGEKCDRCWVFAEDRGRDPAHPTLCGKCTAALA
jgi:isoleucyl-tRNA synthetase